jgi:hypothetical protein
MPLAIRRRRFCTLTCLKRHRGRPLHRKVVELVLLKLILSPCHPCGPRGNSGKIRGNIADIQLMYANRLVEDFVCRNGCTGWKFLQTTSLKGLATSRLLKGRLLIDCGPRRIQIRLRSRQDKIPVLAVRGQQHVRSRHAETQVQKVRGQQRVRSRQAKKPVRAVRRCCCPRTASTGIYC